MKTSMQKINSASTLRDAIVAMEMEHAEEGKQLKQQFQLAYESIKPLNLIKRTWKDVVGSQELKNGVVDTSVELFAGYLSKLLFVNASHSRLRKVFGVALQIGVTNLVAKNPEIFKSIGKGLFTVLTRGFKKRGPGSGKSDDR